MPLAPTTPWNGLISAEVLVLSAVIIRYLYLERDVFDSKRFDYRDGFVVLVVYHLMHFIEFYADPRAETRRDNREHARDARGDNLCHDLAEYVRVYHVSRCGRLRRGGLFCQPFA